MLSPPVSINKEIFFSLLNRDLLETLSISNISSLNSRGKFCSSGSVTAHSTTDKLAIIIGERTLDSGPVLLLVELSGLVDVGFWLGADILLLLLILLFID